MTQAARPVIAGNTSTGLLKILALVCMFCDHAGKMCFPDIPELRIIGRIAFPLYCWCMVVGASHTRSMPRYMLRLALVGLLSQPIYMVALNHPANVPNIFLTLLLGLMGVWGMQQKRWMSHIWAPVLSLCAAHLLNCNAASYGWKGVLLLFLLWGVRDCRRGIAAMMIAFCLFWGSGSISVTSFFGIPLSPLTRSMVGSVIAPWLKLQTLALLALPLMLWPDEIRLPHRMLQTRMPRIPMPRWLGYAIYPLHLMLLIALEYAMGVAVHWEHLSDFWQQLVGWLA